MDVVALEKTEGYQDRYRVEGTLGAGGMGVIYLAEDIKLGRKVAIKQLRSDLRGDSAEARFRREAQLLARLSHPNIVRLYDVLEGGTSIALVMELVEGVTLKEWMRERTATLAEKLDLLMQICQGLGKAHSMGIIHRDLKLENILVTTDGVAKITDFGIAKALDCDQQLTREDHIAGSIQAMSPEQVQGSPMDARSDLFSLGSIAYELLCGSKPFERGELCTLAFAQQIVSKPHTPPQLALPDIPKPLAALLDRLLAKRPEQRPESAQQVYAALELVCKHGIDADTQQYSETVTQLLIRPRKKRGRITVGLAGLTLLSFAVFWVWQTFMQLPPQYIAVLPVQFNGELSGEQDTETLVTAVVRQALMNTPPKLKASALVSYNPRQGTSLEEQLQQLHDRGVTDALLARLDCMKQRCNIELQRVNPQDRQIKKQVSLAFITNGRQEAQYTINHASVELFPKSYRKKLITETRMAPEDYNRYLAVLATEGFQNNDLELIEELIGKYPKNINLYSLYSRISTSLFSVSNESRLFTKALGILASAEVSATDETALLEAKLLIKSVGTDKEGFVSTLQKLKKRGYPSATLLAQHARFQFNQGDYILGLFYAEQAAALNPSNANYYMIAINQLATGDYHSTRETLKNLINGSPEYWSAYALLSAIELENGSLDIAEKMIGKIPKEVRSWRTKSNLGTAYFLQGKFSKALTVFGGLSEKSPENPRILYKLAEAHLMLSHTKEADILFSKIINHTHKTSTFKERQIRAGALAYIGRTADSIALIKEVIRESPDTTYTKYTAAQVYALAGEWQSANYHLEQLFSQGMGAEWFTLPAFQLLCSQSQISGQVSETICQQ